MNEREAVQVMVWSVKEYAKAREYDMVRGAETPHLSALLVQKYGLGVTDTIAALYGGPRAADPIREAVDHEVGRIDPEWHEHAQQRWAGKPAEVVSKS